MNQSDTIAAIATALSPSGIGIVRISGEDAIAVADRIFKEAGTGKKLAQQESHTIHYGHIVDGEMVVDEVMVMLMKAPRSYTREDTVEIDCHGGILVVQKVLELAQRAGARLAEPGEFTKRAFLNGRIDLSQAEAVMELIQAKSDYALQGSLNQLGGVLSGKIKKLREEILYQTAYLEAALDDPEHISLDGYSEALSEKVNEWLVQIQEMAGHFQDRRLLQEGIRTVILGRPNVGKSSLMNLLLGEDRAIVTEIAGTTRDTLEEYLLLHEVGLILVDTAGIHDTRDVVEQIGVNKAREKAKDADLILFVVDSSSPLTEEDYEIMDLIRYRKALVILNKTDLEPIMQERELKFLTQKEVISFSAKTGEGLKKLKESIENLFYAGELKNNGELFMINARHKEAFEKAEKSLCLVREAIENQMPEDLYTIDLTGAYEELGRIIGESVGEDLIEEIFSRFCMGK